MTREKKMRNKIERLLFDQNWGNSQFEITEVEDPHLISAGTHDTGHWKIFVDFDKRIDKLDDILGKINVSTIDKLRGQRSYFDGKDNLDSLLYFVVGHEVGHWKHCPGHIDDREEIMSGVAEGLQRIGFDSEKVENQSQRVYNMFADILDNVMSMYRDKKKEKFQEGFLGFYAKEGSLCEYSDDFYLFVDTQVRLGIDEPLMKKFASFFRKDKDALSNVTKEILNILVEDSSLAAKIMNEQLTLQEKVDIYHRLNEKNKWHRKARDFASLLGKYIKEQDPNDNRLSHGYGGQSGKPRQQQGSKGNNKHEGCNHADDKNIRELVKRSLKKGHSVGYAPKTIALDELYKMRAERIVMDLKKREGDMYRLAVAYLQRKEITNSNFNMNNVDWQNPEIGMDEKGQLTLDFLEKLNPVFADKKGAEKGGRLPDILFIVDRSGSVIEGYDPGRGTGAYDMILRSMYSVFKYLEDNNQIQNMRFGTILFDNIPNYFSGWKTFYDMQDIKDPLLMPGDPKFNPEINFIMKKMIPKQRGFLGGTNLDLDTIVEATDDKQGNYWAIIISDGEIHNRGEAREAVQYMADKGNPISFIRVGYSMDNEFAEYVSEVGGQVYHVKDASDLSKLVLKEAKHHYA